jgi:GAF domain-containing protein
MKKDLASSTTAQPGERARLEALRRYRILDTPEDPEFDRIARLAARLLRTPIGLVSLVDENRQWFKSHFGLEIRETARELSFCAHALASDEVMVVRDATKDERFATNALVTGQPDLRFYAGAPLRTKDGFRLGTLSVLDTQARYDLGPDDFTTLEHLAALVMDHLELRLANVLTEDYAAKIGQLPHAAGIIATSDSVEAALQVVADHINSLIGVRRAVAILTDGSTVARAANADDFAGQRCIARADHGLELEIGAIIRNQKRTMQVTRSDLERSYQAGPQASFARWEHRWCGAMARASVPSSRWTRTREHSRLRTRR